MASARPSRRPASTWTRTRTRTAVATGVAALALAGCSATNPITTQTPYNVVDGFEVEVGETVSARNLIVFTPGEGEPGTMIGALSNRGKEPTEVTIAPEGADAVTVEVPGGSTVLLGGERGEPVELESVGAIPGGLLPITVSTPEGGETQARVPVFDGTLPEYQEIVPVPED